MYGKVLSACTGTCAAIMLPSTGSNRVVRIVVASVLVVSGAILLSGAARLVAKKVYKA
jgi:hypothetical protein